MTSEPPCVPSEFAPVCAGPEAIAHGPHGALDAQVSAWWERARSASRREFDASFATPVRSIAALRRNKCPSVGPSDYDAPRTKPFWARPKLLRVPKSASSFFVATVSQGCNESGRDPIPIVEHQAPPSNSCHATTIATLREPCERFVSIFRQLEAAFAPETSMCRYYRNRCPRHWVNAASDVNHFASLTRERWVSMLGTPSISLDERLPSRNTTESLYALLKHTALAVPQALYIGNYTAVLCVDSTLSQQVVHLRRELHCRGQPSPLLQRPGERFNAHRARPGIGARNGDAPDGADGGARYVLTAQGCAEVRALYTTDVALWERLCKKEQSRRRL